jgi:propanediol dehydratase large subunit
MKSDRWVRRLALVAGGGAIIAMGSLTACSSSESPAPSSTTTTTTTTTTSVSPTEKSLTPGGANSFSPTVLAPPAPTAIPGTHRND